jgi:hydrogenase nickel incorporation protein HypB
VAKETGPSGGGETRVEGGVTVVTLEAKVLKENARQAAENRELLSARRVHTVNLISSPGAGKTTLLVETLRALRGELRCAVIEGDQQTANDALRIAETGVPVVQINTVSSCHLNAAQVRRAFDLLDSPGGIDLLFIENVGNLICPTAYDLGEDEKVVLLSVTEGEDKPAKYPSAFSRARAMLVTKTDLLPHLRFDLELCRRSALRVNPALRIIETSAYDGAGIEGWLAYLREAVAARRSAAGS